MSELVYDVQNKTYLSGRALEPGESYVLSSLMQVTDHPSDSAQIVRSLCSGFVTLQSKLSEWLVSDKASSDDILIDRDEVDRLVLELKMPSNYNQATVDSLSNLSHDYLVSRALSDWYLETNKEYAGDYVQLSGVYLSQLLEALHKRVRPSRPVN